MKRYLTCLLLCFPFLLPAQVDPQEVTIVRDGWGVPHIYAKTDAGGAYGLAYAYAEDDFESSQQSLLAVNGKLSQVKGKKGALFDMVAFLVDADGLVEEKYETDVSPEFKKVLAGYAQGLNDYAERHPEEVLRKGVFPISGKTILKGYVTNLTFMSNVHFDLLGIFEGTIIAQEDEKFSRGSNGWAISPNMTADGETYLVSNSHQPLEGPLAWYECHIETEEGWHFLGATFAGGVTPFLGTNPNLGWTHTVNHDDYCDVYKLVMHPDEKLKYKFDGEWLTLEERKLKLNVKVGPVKIPVRKAVYRSKYGPTLKSKTGFYSLRFPSNMSVKAAEQWFRMNKAKNLEEFQDAIRMQGIPNLNIIYGDQEGNIMFLGHGLFPKRDPNFQWDRVLPGDTSATLWAPDYFALEEEPQVVNPNCGYVYNMNNSSMSCTAPEENPKPGSFPKTMGLQQRHTARSLRFIDLIEGRKSLTYEEMKEIKYDSHMKLPLYTRAIKNLDQIRNLDQQKYSPIADVIDALNRWDGGSDADNRQAAIFAVAVRYYVKYMRDEGLLDYNNVLPERVLADGLFFARDHLNKHFGKWEVPLGDLQKHIRGDKELPMWGVPEAITQIYTEEYEDGKFKSYSGESYILFIRYNKENKYPVLESVHPYGTSSHPESPHYNDQMEKFVNKQLKPMSMDEKVVRSNAERIYHPGE